MRTLLENTELELILTFLGIEFIDYKGKRTSNGHVSAKTYGEIYFFFGKSVMTSGQHIEDITWWDFKNDWNDLIFLVKKIKEIVESDSNFITNLVGYEQRFNSFIYDKDSIYKASIEFIKLYNHKKA